MTAKDAAKILLVRSIEEADKTAFPAEKLEGALAAAAGDVRPSSWFLNRASYLLDSGPHPYRSILRLAQLPEGWTLPIGILSLLLGIATNYLGPVEKIPLILNPLMALVAWNALMYLVLFFVFVRSRLKKRKVSPAQNPPAKNGDEGSATTVIPPSRVEHARAPWILRVLFPAVWASIHKFALGFHATTEQVTAFVDVARRFWSRWVEAAEPLLVARWKRLLHVAAIFLTVGAITGMYVRGLFLEYKVIWASTFVTGENTVSRVVDSIFGPAMLLAQIAGQDLSARINIARLMSPEGDAAAAWIHLFALTALLLIIIPRSLLAAFQWFHVRRAASAILVDFDEYFAARIRPQIGALMAAEVEPAIKRFAEAMASFVCRELYDSRIVPELRQFRETGGRINDLKERIQRRCEEFSDEIRDYGGAAVKELEASVTKGLERVMSAVQQDFRLPEAAKEDLSGGLQLLPSRELEHPLRPLGGGITDALSMAVSTSAALALGTVAGGFGESLEVAIIVALFGTTGPVGFLIGALIGLIVGAGAWWFGREKITGQVENISLPGPVVRAALWQSRFDKLVQEGRTKCYDLVKTRARELLSPLPSQIASEIWTGLERLWRQRSNAESPTF